MWSAGTVKRLAMLKSNVSSRKVITPTNTSTEIEKRPCVACICE